jgi:Ras family protein T1
MAKAPIRVVVVGDRGTGKSSLILTAAEQSFPINVQPVLPPTTLPEDFFPDSVPITIIDTSSRVADDYKVAEELKRADAVVITYACDDPTTLDRLGIFWLPKLCKLEVKAPVILVGCKLDLRDPNQKVSLEKMMSPIMGQFQQIGTSMECSAIQLIQTRDAFYHAQTAVLHPKGPLLDNMALVPRCRRALKRIFILCDHDRDGALSDAELNAFQVKLYDAEFKPSEIVGIKRIVAKELPEGVNDLGLTLMGFLYLHVLFLRNGHPELIWTVLRKFGYNNDVKLADDLIPSFKRAPDQSVELTNEAIEFLRGIVLSVAGDDGELGPHAIDDIFSTAAESPWETEQYAAAVQKNVYGGLSLDGFLSMWAFMTLVDPALSMENMICLDYPGDPSSTFRVTRERHLACSKQQTDRNVFQCVVFGAKKAGKSALLNSFVGRRFSDEYASTIGDHYAVNVVDEPCGAKKTLVLREIPEERVSELLLDKESLAACDVAVFVHDSSNAFSWERATEFLEEVASHGKDTGFEVPCLIVAAKYDLGLFPMAKQHYDWISGRMGIEAPIPISTKLGNLNHVFRRIVSAAEHPHLSIPKT